MGALRAEDPVGQAIAAVCAGVVLVAVISVTVASWRRGPALVHA
ncbi:hypothetical protein GCM10010121_086940 [Streptomyces brasiliensis]|uniref:Uncharacterized protein n=1 Tax=Streptomyces brasiliensis TaxID=1954 RepID=A0A917UJT7_9ACTN|nr:hypothetical protein GCM10010121_086940 [Streptomyces brasiliensis]